MDAKYNKILIITDVHGLINELFEFLDKIKKKYGDTIAYCVQLGDFFKGRNVLEGERTFTFWRDPKIFKNLPFPIYCIKGNEDINIPDEWWSGLLIPLPFLETFILDDFKAIAVDYIDETQEFFDEWGITNIKLENEKQNFSLHSRRNNKHNKSPKSTKSHELNIGKFMGKIESITPAPKLTYSFTSDSKLKRMMEKDNAEIDFIFSHQPPYGYLDKTRDYESHQEIHNTGSIFVRILVDYKKPKVLFFGHNHYCNYEKFGDMLIISIDKFCRKIPDFAFQDDILDSVSDDNLKVNLNHTPNPNDSLNPNHNPNNNYHDTRQIQYDAHSNKNFKQTNLTDDYNNNKRKNPTSRRNTPPGKKHKNSKQYKRYRKSQSHYQYKENIRRRNKKGLKSGENYYVNEQNIFSYALIIQENEEYFIELYRKNKIVFKYNLSKSKVLFSKLK
ncbi:MAG: metallophosphoesterase family protein [Promethearchaeota archaeon]